MRSFGRSLRRRTPALSFTTGSSRASSTTAGQPPAPGASASASSSSPPPSVSREVAIKRWNVATASPLQALAHRLPAALSAAGGAARHQHGGLEWDVHEKMDFHMEWRVPAGWDVNHRVAENFVAIHCTPPKPEGAAGASPAQPAATVHGMSLSAFAYPTKVKAADDNQLLTTFLAQFGRSVGNSVQTIGSTARHQAASSVIIDPTRASEGDAKAAGGEDSDALRNSDGKCREVSRQVGGAVCEVTFQPPRCPVRARAYCRAFFHRTRRFHCVALFAVPEDEWSAMHDSVLHAVVSATECGGDLFDHD